MSGRLCDFVEARLDAMNGFGRSNLMVRDPAPPITPNSTRKAIRNRHATEGASVTEKMTESIHEHFGWLEEFVDVKLEMMEKRDAMSIASLATDASCSTLNASSTEIVVPSPLRGCPLGAPQKGGTHRRMHARGESLLIGVFELDEVYR